MLAITCDKCRRRYTATDEELRVYLQQAEGKKFAQVLCPHCGKPSKIAENRIRQALRFSQPAEGQAAPEQTERPAIESPATGAAQGLGGPPGASDLAATGSVPEEENPPA